MSDNTQDGGAGGIDLGGAVTDEGSEDSSSSGSNSGGNGGRRSTVIVKGHYGTEQVPPDTECEKCSRRAVGVLVLEQRLGNKGTKKTRPLCSNHRDSLKAQLGDVWEEYDFRRFVDQ